MTITSDTRQTVIDSLDRTLFVEAGAGSGKTSCLVNRFVALVESGVRADRIAAITYTTKAANELVERIRTRLEERAREGSELCRSSLSFLDGAAICTVHSFAQRILTEHPIEAGLPPSVSVIDEIAAKVAFESRWEDYVDRLLTDDSMERAVRLLLACGGSIDKLRSVAVQFNDNWDLVEERADRRHRPLPPVDVSGIFAALADVAELAEHCTTEDDKLFVHITGKVGDFEQALRQAEDDDAKLELLAAAKLKKNAGQKGNWPDIEVAEVRDMLGDIQTACTSLVTRVKDMVLQALAASLADFTLDGAAERRAAGELEYHDLLVLARAVMRDANHGPAVREALSRRYQCLLIDEFQDTDPIQVELAVLIASDDPEAGGKDWRTVVPRPGHLFFVGDPKQAIYRFRRADIATFLDTRDLVVGCAETLMRNYRTSETILKWVNATFGQLIQEEAGSQPEYSALVPVRDNPAVGPAVSFIGTEHEGKASAEELREAEASDVATAIRLAIGDQWLVSERLPDGSERWRPARWSDVAILVPSRTSLPELESALEAADIPYRVETSNLVYGTREIRDLMLITRAVDDPTDALSVVAALRTPSFACGDDDLLVWKRRYRGSWDYVSPFPAEAPLEHPVRAGLERLRGLHEQRRWQTPSQSLDTIVREGRFFELGATARRPRDLWRRLRFVLDQCRAWEEAGGVTLRQYLRWIASQSVEGERAKETVLPETDDDAVRILTIYGAKGLEFPIAVVSGMTSAMVYKPPGVEVRFPASEGWAIKLSKDFATEAFEFTSAIEEQRDRDERIRLLYVATTRARDHLVVSVHRAEENPRAETSAEVLYEAGWDASLVELLDLAGREFHPDAAPARRSGEAAAALPSLEEWRRMHESALEAASRPIAISATGLAAEEAAWDEDDERPRRRGPAGTGAAVGSAVHAVMQIVDLSSGEGLAAICAAQAAAAGVGVRAEVIEALCRSALESDVIKRAAQGRHWREVYVGVPDGDRVLEGFIDLLYEDGEGVAIVDYKTDSWSDESELDAKVERYRGQMRAYARAVRESVGKEVTSAILLFLNRDGAIGRHLETETRDRNRDLCLWKPRQIRQKGDTVSEFGMDAVDALYQGAQIDDRWAVRDDRGFTWWPGDLAQHVSLGPVRSTPAGDECTLTVWVDLVTDVDPAANPAKFLGLLNMRELAMNAAVWDQESATIKMFCSLSLNEGNTGSAARLIGLASVLQNSMAQAVSERLALQCGGSRAVSSHPHTGSHADPDDLRAFAAMVIDAGQEPSIFSRTETGKLLGRFRKSWMSGLPAIAERLGCRGSGNDSAFTAEVPFDGSDYRACVEVFTEPHPVWGNGAWVVLQLPLAPGTDEAFILANALNAQEFDWVPPGLSTLGAWSPDFLKADMDGLAFSTFVPNKLAGSGMLENLFIYAALRARFAADVLSS